MEIAKHDGYETALVTVSAILPVTVLHTRVKQLRIRLQQMNCKPYEPVLIYIEDKTWLLPALWAALKCGLTIIPSNPGATGIAGLPAIDQYKAVTVITEKKIADTIQSFRLLVADEETVAPVEEPLNNNSDDLSVQFIFQEQDDVQSPEGFASGKMVEKYFEELDQLQTTSADDILLLSEEVPYAQQVLALLWASRRGIPVITERINNKTLSARYASSADNFPMEFGLFHFGSYAESATDNKYSQLFDTVQFADKNGFVAVWTPERHFNQFGGLFPNPSVLSAALAVSTSRVQIRCGSIVAPLHHPVRIAEDWSLIDNLSGGRAAVSFASGWQCDDFIFFPDNYPERHQCMMDQLSIVKKLWKGEKLLFRNGLNKEVEIGIFPKPVQQEIPVWITVSNRTETFIDAGKVGANILTHLLWQDTDELIEKIAAYRKSLEENGYDPRSRKVSLMVHTYLGNDNETVKNKVREPLKNYIRSSTQLIQAMAKSNAGSSNAREVGGRYGSLNNEVPAHLMDELVEIAFNRFFEEAALLGTVDKAAKLLRKLKTYDVDEIASLIDFGLSRDEIMEGLTYLNELKNKYDRKGHNLSPVTITYCSDRELDLLPGIQRVILAEGKGSEKNDNPVPQGTSVVRQYREDGEIIFTIKHSGAATVAAEDFFTTAVSSDFE